MERIKTYVENITRSGKNEASLLLPFLMIFLHVDLEETKYASSVLRPNAPTIHYVIPSRDKEMPGQGGVRLERGQAVGVSPKGGRQPMGGVGAGST